jgi:hypothetical protein
MSSHLAVRWVPGLLLGLLASPAWALDPPAGEGGPEEVPLKYQPMPVFPQPFATGGQSLGVPKDRPPLKEEPKYRSWQPLYRILRLGAKEREFTAVLDSSRGEARGYDTLYVDADGEGRLTPPEKWTGALTGSGRVFGPVKFLVEDGAECCPQWFLFRLTESETAEGKVRCHLHAYNAGHYTGTVRFGDRKCRLVLLDDNANGLFSDVFQHEDESPDRLVLESVGSGPSTSSPRGDRSQPLGRWVEVGGRYWQLDVVADGSQVTVRPLNKPLGSVRLKMAIKVDAFTLLLRGPEGLLEVQGKDGPARLPAGRYRFLRGEYQFAPGAGLTWHFRASAPDVPDRVDVPAAGETAIPFGPPLVPKVSVTRKGGDLLLDLEVRGTGGERYYDFGCGEHGQPPAPRVELRDATGRKLDALDFHYG